MTDNTAAVLMLAAFFALCGFVCWLHARYPRSSGERESSVYKWTTITQAQPERIAPSGNIECARTRKPKPVPAIQPNRRKKKKARR